MNYNPTEIKSTVDTRNRINQVHNTAAKGRVENNIDEKKISKDYPWVTVVEVQKFHDKTLGLNDCSRWNGLRVLEKNAWTKYYLENKDRDGIDIEPILTEPSNGMMLPQLTEITDEQFLDAASQAQDDYNKQSPCRKQFIADLDEVTQQIFDLLSEKNLKYGDSALNPSGIFARGLSAIDLINARMDDKLARLKNGAGVDDEDPEWDLIGYLVLKRIAVKRLSEKIGSV